MGGVQQITKSLEGIVPSIGHGTLKLFEKYLVEVRLEDRPSEPRGVGELVLRVSRRTSEPKIHVTRGIFHLRKRPKIFTKETLKRYEQKGRSITL